ncbi:hypothetical protein COB87_000155 [Candidatus Wolfebacteria bacterium]|nr:hypothetical protein [Candidatus Wolfebacteria bacterium]
MVESDIMASVAREVKEKHRRYFLNSSTQKYAGVDYYKIITDTVLIYD